MGVYVEQKPKQKDRKKEQRQAMLKCGSGFRWEGPCMGFADHRQHVPIEKVEDLSISFAAFLFGFRALGPLKVSFIELPRRRARQSLRHGVRSRKVLVRGTQACKRGNELSGSSGVGSASARLGAHRYAG